MTRSIVRYARLTWFFGGVSLRRLLSYRTDFLLGTFGLVAQLACQVLLIGTVFSFGPTLDGWSHDQVLFLFGFSLLPRAADRLFTDWLWFVGGRMVQTGEFDKYLVRPLNPLYSVLSERFLWPDGFGEMAIGLSLVGYAGHRLGLDLLSARLLIVGPVLVLCGALVYASAKLLSASLAFWTVVSYPTMHSVVQVSEFSGYPLGIFPAPFRWAVTWVLPFAFTSFVPAGYLLSGRTGLVVWTPVITVAAVVLAVTVWTRGVARYESTGS